MEEDTELQAHAAELQLKGQAALTRQERLTRQRALDKLQLPSFYDICKVARGGRAGGGRSAAAGEGMGGCGVQKGRSFSRSSKRSIGRNCHPSSCWDGRVHPLWWCTWEVGEGRHNLERDWDWPREAGQMDRGKQADGVIV